MATTVTTRQLARWPVLQISSAVIALIAVALVAVAVSVRPPDTSQGTVVSPPSPQLGSMWDLPDSVIHADQPVYTSAAP
jgi:hypothetical protein